jgi:hypothetical protein
MQSIVPMTKGETTAKIHELIKERLNDGQFEECDLTFKDLHVIQEAFVSVYDGMTHNRVRYPELKALAKKSGISVEIDENGEENVSEKNTAPSKKKPSAESTDGIPVKNNEPPEKAAGQNEAQGEDH